MVHDVFAKYQNTWGPNPKTSVDPKSVAAKLAGELTVHVLDPEGRPVTGASSESLTIAATTTRRQTAP